MPKLGATTTKLTMPSSTDDDPAWIEIKTVLYPLDILDLQENPGNEYNTFCEVAARSIVAWNYVDVADGSPITPTADWIDKLPNEDKKILSEHISALMAKSFEGLSNDEKKTLSAPLTEAAPTVTSPPII